MYSQPAVVATVSKNEEIINNTLGYNAVFFPKIGGKISIIINK